SQKVYTIEKQTYYSLFGEWKPQQNRKVNVCFMHTYNEWRFYSYIECAAGSFEYDLPMKLFVRDIKEKAFLKRLGIQ
ncbi:MAG: hypothetical protein Q4A05_06785, partial [Ruminococcus sp.]|nr:hypothetical protein [Ruminococcus sp.]